MPDRPKLRRHEAPLPKPEAPFYREPFAADATAVRDQRPANLGQPMYAQPLPTAAPIYAAPPPVRPNQRPFSPTAPYGGFHLPADTAPIQEKLKFAERHMRQAQDNQRIVPNNPLAMALDVLIGPYFGNKARNLQEGHADAQAQDFLNYWRSLKMYQEETDARRASPDPSYPFYEDFQNLRDRERVYSRPVR